MGKPLLLIVDDEKATREGLLMALEEEFEVFLASSLAEAKVVLESESVDGVLTDLRLSGESGMDVLSLAQGCERPPVCIMMTAYGSIETAVAAMKRGAWSFVTKPLNLDEVEILLKRALKTRRLEEENVELNTRLKRSGGMERLLGGSEAMERVFRQIRQVAPSSATVLIEGESGTGKELVGHAIHTLSGRPDDKFVVVNCAALSPQLLESELFGHEKGAFTGAVGRRIGRFEQAHGGTLFLDEIGEIDEATQVKLLRALSERTIERVGSSQSIRVNVRVVSATNRDLAMRVKEGKFREDLYYRLNVVRIVMPPLRERKEDILLLAQSFLKEFRDANNRSDIRGFSAGAKEMLQAYDWPGNVRQLRTAVEHGVVMATGEWIGEGDLPMLVEPARGLGESANSARLAGLDAESGGDPGSNEGIGAKKIGAEEFRLEAGEDFNLSRIESRVIRMALERTRGNVSRAAQLLGISRRTLQRKLAGE